ncbi:MAG: hypothetical protein AAGI49_07585 [Bacteroidota bacterium]
MKIINPLYDYAFKYLMQNNRIAKKVLSTLLECEVEELTVEQQEIVAVDDTKGLKLYRLDFSATIINESGEKQKVLIELQKSKLPTNELRFRTYLGENYLKKETKKKEDGTEEFFIYPIISIYILGYKVTDIPYLAISIDNRITNTVTKEEVAIESDFIELLTHKTRIIQIRRLSEERRTQLEKFLTLFNQAWTSDPRYIIDLKEVPEGFEDVAKYLQGPVQDEEFRNRLKGEEELDLIFAKQDADLAKARQEAEKAKQEAEKAKQKAEEAEQEAEEAKQEVKEAKQNVASLQVQFAKHLLSTGVAVDQVAQQTGLEITAVEALKNDDLV